MITPSLPRRFGRAAVVLLVCLVAAASGGAADEFRTWTDATGKFKLEAKLVGVTDGKATLERPTGASVEIDVKKLSPADQKFIEDQQTENPFVPKEENPFKTKTTANPFKNGGKAVPARRFGESGDTPAGDAAPSDVKGMTIDWSSAQPVALMPAQDSWKFAVPIAGQTAELKPRVIPIPPKTSFWEGSKGMVVSASGERALIGYATDEPKPAGTTRVVLCDLTSGKMLVNASTSGKLSPLALHDRGTQVLMRRNEFGFGNSDYLELWNLSPQGIARVVQWHPYADEKGGNRDVKWGAFLDEERIVTLGANGKLVVWNAQTIEPLYHLKIDGGSRPALSPDRKLLAFSTGKQIGVLDVNKREVVALQATAHTPWPVLEFSPDGARLACSAQGKIYVWNFATGELFREIPLTGQNISGDMVWPHERYLLLGKSTIFDLENQVPLWTYRGADQVERVGKFCLFAASEGHERPGALVLAAVPPPTFEAKLAEAQKDPNFFVLKPGVTVKLNVDALPDPAEREKVKESLTAKLKERGFQVGSNGTIELVATSEAGKEREISYHGFGISPWKTYKVREYLTRLAFNYQGKTVWQTQGSSVPGVISLKEGETIEQVLRRSERPNYSVYQHVELPKMLLKPLGAGGLGTSQVSVAGVE